MAHSKQIVKISPTAAVLQTIGPAPQRSNSLWSFNQFNCIPLQNSIRNAPNVPISVQEQMLITELLYCLVGVRGTNIWPEITDTLDDFQPIKFRINESIQISYQDIIQEVNNFFLFNNFIDLFIFCLLDTAISQSLLFGTKIHSTNYITKLWIHTASP